MQLSVVLPTEWYRVLNVPTKLVYHRGRGDFDTLRDLQLLGFDVVLDQGELPAAEYLDACNDILPTYAVPRSKVAPTCDSVLMPIEEESDQLFSLRWQSTRLNPLLGGVLLESTPTSDAPALVSIQESLKRNDLTSFWFTNELPQKGWLINHILSPRPILCALEGNDISVDPKPMEISQFFSIGLEDLEPIESLVKDNIDAYCQTA